ncbi:MAG TPA: hypothetical protein VNK43_07145 [Gemmatimonadales bacterium]|nr:hypothetical protein [Gemmatimonadales bacterium]
MSRRKRSLPAAAADLPALRARVGTLAENRPAVYRMIDAEGCIIYIGKAKRLRARLLAYFRAPFPEDKAARILHAARTIEWDYVPSEFAAHLGELRQIRRFRPRFNVQFNRDRRAVFVKISRGPAPRVYVGGLATREDARCYGPFTSAGRATEAVRTLNDLLGLRDCERHIPIRYAGQEDLFGDGRQALCMRQELGLCAGPCAALVTELDYRRRLETAAAFLEGRTIQPIDKVVHLMQAAAAAAEFEVAARWREKFEQLEWLLAAVSRARAAVGLLSFVYREPGAYGDDWFYLLRHGVVRAGLSAQATPLERAAFDAEVARAAAEPELAPGPLPLDRIDEILLMMSWFRKHPEALRRTMRYAEWAPAAADRSGVA